MPVPAIPEHTASVGMKTVWCRAIDAISALVGTRSATACANASAPLERFTSITVIRHRSLLCPPQWDDTNYNSNMTPQASALNQGPWQRLEGRERSVTLATGGPIYVYTGPLFERMMKPMPAGPQYHRVPSGYWKIVAHSDGRRTAFVMDQNTPCNTNHCNYRDPRSISNCQ